MTHGEFIEVMAGYVEKYAPEYEICVYSPVIAQGILESGWGETVLAKKYHNYFGLKCGSRWTGRSVNLKTQEEYTRGTMTTIRDHFRVYGSMEEGVKGYFEFLQLKRYQNLKGIRDPEKYLKMLKNEGYATDSKYVEKNMQLIQQYNLTKYDPERKKKVMRKAEAATQWMERHAQDNRCGYDQVYRWGERGDYDCSAAVITAWQSEDVPVKTKGATYTGNMLPVFLKCGFRDVTKSVNLRTGEGLIRGDVLLRNGHHTAMYCGKGKEVEASINEKGRATGGRPGDQTGREFLIRSYRNYPWSNVLRYDENAFGSGQQGASGSATVSSVLRRGNTGSAVKEMQRMLITCGYGCGADGADGQFGSATYAALICFQRSKGLIADGEYGSQSSETLKKEYQKKCSQAALDQVAIDVIKGKYGNGEERKKRLRKDGYDPGAVQRRVNRMV